MPFSSAPTICRPIVLACPPTTTVLRFSHGLDPLMRSIIFAFSFARRCTSSRRTARRAARSASSSFTFASASAAARKSQAATFTSAPFSPASVRAQAASSGRPFKRPGCAPRAHLSHPA